MNGYEANKSSGAVYLLCLDTVMRLQLHIGETLDDIDDEDDADDAGECEAGRYFMYKRLVLTIGVSSIHGARFKLGSEALKIRGRRLKASTNTSRRTLLRWNLLAKRGLYPFPLEV